MLHNDVHPYNWYITGDRKMGLLDWQCICRGQWSRDLAYAMSSMLCIEDRRKWERDLLKLYIEKMYELTNESIDFDEAWLRYRQQVLGPLLFATLTYSPPAFAPKDMQPPEHVLELIIRFSQAIEDLESLDSL